MKEARIEPDEYSVSSTFRVRYAETYPSLETGCS